MDKLISLEPSKMVAIRVEPGERCRGELTLRNVMHTMPVAFRFQPQNPSHYSARPQTGIIPPLAALTLEVVYHLPTGCPLPDSLPHSDDSFLLHSVVVPGAGVKDAPFSLDSVPLDWFTAKKKQVFTDSSVRVVFVGSAVLARLFSEVNTSLEVVREVLERSDPEWRAADSIDPDTGETLLQLAVARGRPDLVQLLLEFGPDLESTGRSGWTPLEAAAAAGEALMAELLLARSASVSRSPASALGPLHRAAAGGHTEVLRLLLGKGADPDEPAADGSTALRLAVEGRRRACIELLLAAGCRVDARGGADGDTPLHVAAAAGDEATARLLLRRGGLACKGARNARGLTACDVAAERGQGRRLLDALGLGDRLHAAARKGDAAAVRRLVEAGAAVDGRDQHGWTALMRAGFKGRVGVMRALLEAGAAVDAREGEGYTALHCAVEGGQAEAAVLLVKRGADVGATTAKGATAMQIADELGDVHIARILAQGGAAVATSGEKAASRAAGLAAEVAAATKEGKLSRAVATATKEGKLTRAAMAAQETEGAEKARSHREKKGFRTKMAAKRSSDGGLSERGGWPAVTCSH
ncbi:hypothetical protein Taro_006984 [Colocasia esculenta]|uniref:MSP domain-containing protein n=1 Tax=Colocasia esculenta TaxID=4460 RepID=A0A843TYX0_COLES|nr:hypothetical protein [Colocasia esculenta]